MRSGAVSLGAQWAPSCSRLMQTCRAKKRHGPTVIVGEKLTFRCSGCQAIPAVDSLFSCSGIRDDRNKIRCKCRTGNDQAF